MKKKSRKHLIRLLDQKASKEAKERHKQEYGRDWCYFCYLRGSLPETPNQCFHLFSRAHYSTRWLPENCFWSCAGCNLAFEGDVDFIRKVIDWYIKKFGQAQYDLLNMSWHKSLPIKNWELEEMLNKP